MDTIKTYIENMFKGFPKTDKVLKIKRDLLSNMIDKFNELKSEGKSENEAVGIVISEFGNIDDIVNEFKISYKEKEEVVTKRITGEEVNDYLTALKINAIKIGIGTFLCIIGGALLVLLMQLTEDGYLSVSDGLKDTIGLIPLLVLVGIAVALFINAGYRIEKFNYIKEDNVELAGYVKNEVEERNAKYFKGYQKLMVVGIVMCILSPITILLTSNLSDSATVYGVVGLMSIVSVAVFIIVYSSIILDGYKILSKK